MLRCFCYSCNFFSVAPSYSDCIGETARASRAGGCGRRAGGGGTSLLEGDGVREVAPPNDTPQLPAKMQTHRVVVVEMQQSSSVSASPPALSNHHITPSTAKVEVPVPKAHSWSRYSKEGPVPEHIRMSQVPRQDYVRASFQEVETDIVIAFPVLHPCSPQPLAFQQCQIRRHLVVPPPLRGHGGRSAKRRRR